ncbi:MAG: type restriction enzyme subunit [Methanothermococcus sp.]|nr:type restriction enzyme subunit [Methanothermococcus sp.]MDK2987315.1 type restriction enzyme subunit [Methanothermococcus sp.]
MIYKSELRGDNIYYILGDGMGSISEDTIVEQPAINWLSEGEGYQYIHGRELTPEKGERETFADVILKERFIKAIRTLNPNIPDAALEEAYNRIISLSNISIEEANYNFHRLLINGISIEYRDKEGNIKADIVKLIDFNNINNNSFLISNQFVVKEENKDGVRFDLALFINGLPIALFEFKNPANSSIKSAYKQIQNYKELAPQIFYYNEILVISNLLETKIGSITADYERFSKWRGINDKYDYEEKTTPSLEVLIKGLFNKKRLLEYIQDFIVYEIDKKQIIKKIAMYHQFYDVRKAVNRTLKAINSKDKRIGTFWHTQGSGKSLSMLFYTRKIIKLPELNNPTVLILTDRNDLDDQIYKTFIKTELGAYGKKAESIEDLRNKLNIKSGDIIFTTIQKFQLTKDELENKNNTFPKISDRNNIIVIADEAHRSQYKKLAQNIRGALPNAMFIGFTGTPIELEDKSTTNTFGDYAGIYTIKDATEDGAIVPIYYEARFSELHLSNEYLDLDFEDITKELENSKKENVKRRFSAIETLITTPSRMEKIAKDIITHFNGKELDTKAMVVCISRNAAVEMYNYMKKIKDCPEIAVVMSGNKSHDPKKFWEHIRTKHELEELAERFKNPDDPLKIVIVVDMWLTGFDVPVVDRMYIDKPMKNHNLLQAVARVNRVYPNKVGGWIIDYIGITDDLKKSLDRYSGKVVKETMLPLNEALKLMKDKYDIVRLYLNKIDYSNWKSLSNTELAKLIQIAYHKITEEDKKEKGTLRNYLKLVSELTKVYALVSPHPEAMKIRDDLEFFQLVARNLRNYIYTKNNEISDSLEDALIELVNRSIKAKDIVNIFGLKDDNPISIFDPEFLKYLDNIEVKDVRIKVLEKLLNDQVRVLLKRNRIKRKSFQEKIEEAIRKYNNRLITVEQVIEQLMNIAEELRYSSDNAKKLGLTDEEEVFYDALIYLYGNSNLNDDEMKIIIEIVREITEKIKKNLSTDWFKYESSKAKVRASIKRILRKYRVKHKILKQKNMDELTDIIFKQAVELYGDYPLMA